MDEQQDRPGGKDASGFTAAVDAKVARKIIARRADARGVWLGLGMMGLVGWSVVTPTLLGAALGGYIDRHHPGPHSWTLALLIAGLTIGCAIAWRRIAKEYHAMHAEDEHDHE
jgi:ATP synthase protein I